jgi:protein-arginine kinase activator protein McsA
MRESVRQRYEVGRTLDEQLAEAIRAEDYELAARLRDEIREHVPAGGQPQDARHRPKPSET